MFLPRSLFLAMYQNENQQINGRVKKLRFFLSRDFGIKTIVTNYSVIYFLSLFVRLIEYVLGRSKRENSIFISTYLFRMLM